MKSASASLCALTTFFTLPSPCQPNPRTLPAAIKEERSRKKKPLHPQNHHDEDAAGFEQRSKKLVFVDIRGKGIFTFDDEVVCCTTKQLLCVTERYGSSGRRMGREEGYIADRWCWGYRCVVVGMTMCWRGDDGCGFVFFTASGAEIAIGSN